MKDRGFFQIEFHRTDLSANAQFADDLGLGSVTSTPCYAITGIKSAISSTKLTCKFTAGSATTPSSPIIEVYDFQEIKGGTNIEFHIPLIKNPGAVTSSPPIISFRMMKVHLRVKHVLYEKLNQALAKDMVVS